MDIINKLNKLADEPIDSIELEYSHLDFSDCKDKVNELLEFSIENNILSLAKLSIELGADIHAQDDDALCWASEFGHTEIVKLLLDRGADIHAQNDWVLRWASENGHTETVKLLLDRGADIHADNDYAFHCASNRGHTETVKLLKEYIEKENR